MPARRKLTAIVFADIVGFTRQVSRDERAGLERRRRVEERICAAAEARGGRVVKSIGDAVMLEFASAVEAVSCGLEVQEAVRSLAAGWTEPLQVRVGVHAGDVAEEDGDLFGNAVNIAQRVQRMASPGGLCVTREVLDQVRPVLRLEASPVAEELLRTLPERRDVFEVRARQESPAVVRTDDTGGGEARLTLARAQQMADEDEDGGDGWFVLAGVAAILLGAVLLGAGSWVGQFEHWKQVGRVLTVFGSTASGAAALFFFWRALRGIGLPILRWVDYQVLGPGKLDDTVLEKCKALGDVPPAIAEPVGRALSAYQGMIRVARESGWIDARVAIEKSTKQAREELIRLLERARELGTAAASIERLRALPSSSEDYREALALYERQAAALAAAAGVFEEAEVRMTRAFLTLGERGRKAPKSDLLGELGATFDALHEINASLEEPGMPAALRSAADEPAAQVLVQRRGG
jgi:class 3 adenylate cyclase